MRHLLVAVFALPLFAPPMWAAVPEAVVELHQRGYAELENEKPELAEATYRELVAAYADDPLGWANLAIAELRQQEYEGALRSIGTALEKAPDRPDLLAIRAEILQWSGDLDGALAVLDQAATAAPEDLEVLYAAYSHATTVGGEDGDRVALRTLAELAELRPENVVVLIQLAQRAIAAGDRTTTTGAIQRLGELVWQGPDIAPRVMTMVEDALEEDDLAAARIPTVRLENVLKVSPMFRESLRELKTGIQGIPVRRFVDEPQPTTFGKPLTIRFQGQALAEDAGKALAAGDFDGDGRPDLARVGAGGRLEVRLAKGGWKASGEPAAAAAEGETPSYDVLLATDLDNDSHLDLLAFASEPTRGTFWKGDGAGAFAAADGALGLADAGARAAAVIDFDIEGDLDLVLAAPNGLELWRNGLDGPLEEVGERVFPDLRDVPSRALAASDLDRDGDLDLLVAHDRGLIWLDNLRQGRFQDRTARGGLADAPALAAIVAADLDNDGYPDLIGAGDGLTLWHNLGGHFERWPLDGLVQARGELRDLVALDADNDGRLDVAAAGAGGIQVWTQRPGLRFTPVVVKGGPTAAAALAAADLDGDGDLDLAASGTAGLSWLENRGGNANVWLAVHLRGLAKGNSKNNLYGVGSVVELRHGRAFQFREASGDVVHFGLGSQTSADVLRVVWTNGVPQNRLDVAGKQRLVEEQLLKGSCPFLYVWDGERFAFVTDLLWGAPLGLPAGPTSWVGSDPEELVRVDGAKPDSSGAYRLRVTEELWEAAFFDYIRLWIVDHPADVEVASSLRIQPGEAVPEAVLASREVRPVLAAWDGAGRAVGERVRARDEVYADGYPASRYQGVAQRPWTFTFDLGEAPARPIRLHLDGWIFPADASLNLAVAQRDDLPYLPPRLEVETQDGWRELVVSMGFPAGKTKTMVVDTPALPEGARRLRIVTSMWLHWDRIAWSADTADDAPRVRARLLPTSAELRYRGFSRMSRKAPNAPHAYDYAQLERRPPWIAFPGRYTRYGDVGPLLEAPDDFTVILAPGDEMALAFDAGELPPPAPGWRRTVFLESHGWDKDADRNTFAARRVEPLPFRAMSGYPWTAEESYPDTPGHRRYVEEWLTREIAREPN